jgi:hypothetical protein
MKWDMIGETCGMGKMRNTYKISVGKPEWGIILKWQLKK